MRHSIVFALGFAIAALAAGCTSSAAPGPSASAPPHATASIRESCIDPRQIDTQTIVSEQEIRFKLRNGEVWVNKLPQACFGLKIADGFSWDVRGTLVCSNQQRITVRESGTPCLLGAFSKAA